MRRSIISFVVVSVIVVLASSGVSAQNLIVNPDFDTDLTGWSGLGSWDPLDVFGSLASGSATWLNNWAGAGGSVYLMQCVELTVPIESFDL